MLAVRHQLFASKRADLNCGLLWCYSYRTGKGKQQNALWSNSLLACVRQQNKAGKKRLQTWGKLSECNPANRSDQEPCYCNRQSSVPQSKNARTSWKQCSGVIRIAKQALVYCLAVILEVMHKKQSSAKKHLWKLEQLTLKNLLPWLVQLR